MVVEVEMGEWKVEVVERAEGPAGEADQASEKGNRRRAAGPARGGRSARRVGWTEVSLNLPRL